MDRDELIRQLKAMGIELKPRTRTVTLQTMLTEEKKDRPQCLACEGSGTASSGRQCAACKGTGVNLGGEDGEANSSEGEDPFADAAPKEPKKDVSLDDLIAPAKAYMDAHGKESLIRLIERVGEVKKLSALSAENRVKMLAELEKLNG